ncbi:putative 2-oxo-4-hydroxy-4-carboxy-5-ureidoimidazoline decarboxylase, type 1 [Vibrio nigripulchritudo SFn27]|uniref:2-oxo-4-hydroxy-4-carboxy-5-ureidoimidazoline decarboxylase n=1 Tax=Vibrio nigripulchritudo TaxID=28173 RepID=U4KHE6_9VIBR|nr:2-oxo-4-hydroxy-4-carboxy-5-ureidoimidazoline decarboxylase [Vibrio nigripulchritudo]CCN80657.1 putative 2-oxo-4-hydroxy-4-carboxy-5-ureidoimidazoline decarboxylase, type 1 [Vibrio nigripulchritudo BLFn1]CCN89998.1 putative 2-oxo-4-hydroxy-4-carboxy-5-ureidoimidazoline decarboxylase, type 1 [Vibrio nigripulchritudo SFn27]CCN93342.1 putative 2-oxo-4-hydroxy-4-carboxy-5-ureidoimidazoline decarboxylase, type 1 [Vibrio nigripulchritudo ENn2]CCO42228.1 putative 2-oxo-4-hydroxy-4-carboxy-5-ureidoi
MALFKACKPSSLSKGEFIQTFADIYEHSPWVAEKAFEKGISEQDDNIEHLHQKMATALKEADKSAQLKLILAHPDLAGKAAMNGELTQASTSEQAGAGIDQCTPEEFQQFTDFNERYKAKFQFPFIMAVKGSNRHKILESFEQRLENTAVAEFTQAIEEINKIALFRLQDL